MRRPDWVTVVLLSLPPLLWAGNAVLARALVGRMPPLAFSWLRWAVALAVLLPFVAVGIWRHRQVLWAARRDVLPIGLLGVGAYNTLQYLAVQTSTALNVTLIASSMPVFTLALGTLLFGERTRAAQWGGAALSLTGVLWVMLRGSPANIATLGFTPGDLWMLAANACWALYTWMLRKRRPEVPLGPFLGVQIVIGVVGIFPLAAAEAVSGTLVQWSPAVVAGVLYVALLPSLVAYYCWDLGVNRAGAVLPVYFANLTPLFAAVMSAWFLKEWPQVYHGVGLLLIVAGIALAGRFGK